MFLERYVFYDGPESFTKADKHRPSVPKKVSAPPRRRQQHRVFFCPFQKPTLSMCLEEKGFKRQPPLRGTRTRVCVFVCGSELVSCLLFLFFHVFKMRNKLPARREEHEMLGRVLSDSETHRRNTPTRGVPIRAARPNPKNPARCAPVPCGEREILISIKHCVPSSDRCKVGRKL